MMQPEIVDSFKFLVDNMGLYCAVMLGSGKDVFESV